MRTKNVALLTFALLAVGALILFFARPAAGPAPAPKLYICNGYALPRDGGQKNIFLQNFYYLLERPELTPLLDKTKGINPEYEPQNLLTLQGRHTLQADAAAAFKAMRAAAKKDGITITPFSAYRPYEYQEYIYERSQKLRGAVYTDKYIAAPGHSQHQLGTAVDINSTQLNFETTPAFAWLQKNAGGYGFSLSFPDGAQAKTGFFYEPWHYRYISPQGVILQDMFFAGSQHDMLAFFQNCR